MRASAMAILLGALLAPVQAHALYSLYTVPASATITVGQVATVELRLAATLGDAIVGFGLDLHFDPAVVDIDSAAVAPAFDGINEATPSTGLVSLLGLFVDPDAEVSGDILLATLGLRALNPGATALDYAFPGFDTGLSGLFRPSPPGDAVLPDQQEPGQVTVLGPVLPAPTPLALLLPGLIWLSRGQRLRARWTPRRAGLAR